MSRRFVVLVALAAPRPGSASRPRRDRVRWQPAGPVEDESVAKEMVRVLSERSPGVPARVVSLDRLSAEVGSEQAEQILERLHNSTTAEIARSRELEREAAERVAGRRERRSGLERRSGGDRRGSGDRRAGRDRRREVTLSAP